jgi:aminoglycoside 6'-N-acetyltransferase
VILRGPRVTVRALDHGDVSRLAELAAEPGVRRWWRDLGASDLDELAAGREDVTGLAVELDGDVVGLVQYAEEPDPEYRHAGIDVFLGSEAQGRGLGREAVGLVARYLFEQRGHHRLTIDPAADNVRAIRCYAAVGFHPVGVMREYERGLDGRFHDGLLMEMLRSDQPD